MTKLFRRLGLGIVVVAGTTAVDARVIDAETVENVDLVSTGDVTVPVPPHITDPEFELTIGENEWSMEKLPDLPAGGTLTLSFRNHTVGSPPEVERILCPGAENGKRAGVKLRMTGLSAGTEVVATFSVVSEAGVSRVVTLGPRSLEAKGSDVRTGVCQKL